MAEGEEAPGASVAKTYESTWRRMAPLVVGFIGSPLVNTAYSVTGPMVWALDVCQSAKYMSTWALLPTCGSCACARGESAVAASRAAAIILPVIDSPLS